MRNSYLELITSLSPGTNANAKEKLSTSVSPFPRAPIYFSIPRANTFSHRSERMNSLRETVTATRNERILRIGTRLALRDLSRVTTEQERRGPRGSIQLGVESEVLQRGK
jgi:hypothetical protein